MFLEQYATGGAIAPPPLKLRLKEDLSHETFLDYKISHVLQGFIRIVILAPLFQSFFSVFLQKVANLARTTLIIDAKTAMIDSYTKLGQKFKKNSFEC